MGSLPISPPTDPISLSKLLIRAAGSDHGLTFHDDGGARTSEKISYNELLTLAQSKANQLRHIPNAGYDRVVLLHFATFRENMEWFWAVVMAGMLPAISTPLPVLPEQRRKHLNHVSRLLQGPIVLTPKDRVQDFSGIGDVELHVANEIEQLETSQDLGGAHPERAHTDPAVLMLTSGSSGNAKAVVLRHDQLIASVRGKSQHFGTSSADVFLNWIGFDHVASLVETHLHSMYHGSEFVNLNAAAALADPTTFLKLIDQHRVTYTFAPHFFLSKLQTSIQDVKVLKGDFELSCLRHLISGGESNLVATAFAITQLLQQLDIQKEVVKPGFGMTETCAGSIYSQSCPSYDQSQGYEFASLGRPIPGMRMRVMDSDLEQAKPGKVGDLQVTGDQVFREYYNDAVSTRKSFSKDGWFITGDRAFIDLNGCLNMAGREKEIINLNGIKHFPHELESALDNASIGGLTPSWTVVFSSRQRNPLAEELCVVYLPVFDLTDIAKRVETARNIVRIVGSLTFTRPKHIIPLPSRLLHKSTLGKLSRAKTRASFENGEYEPYEDSRNNSIKTYRIEHREDPTTESERAILGILKEVAEVPDEFGVNDSIFDFGITSLDLFSVNKRLETELANSTTIPLGILLTNPTVRGMAYQIERLQVDDKPEQDYDPVVPLQSTPTSNKTPLWLIHPGSGDVLVFVALAKYFPDRMVYGLRTKGLNSGVDDVNYFSSIAEIADCYTSSIRKHQPAGPYALAGYSLGSTVAFEVAKRLENANQEVAFLGLLDSPPHMRQLIEKLDWADVLLNVAYFLELVSEERSNSLALELPSRVPDEALDFVLRCAPRDRLEALAIDKTRLRKLTDVTNAFGMAGKKYDPEGRVRRADIFWVTPLTSVARSRQEWMEEHLVYWTDFVAEAPRFHECDGVHSKMLNLEYVNDFQKVLKKAMAARGI